MRRAHPLIVGGGPSACAAAILLAQAGARPQMLERTREPHDMVCGGFLSADTVRLLAQVGLSVDALGTHPIGRIRVIAGLRTFEADLPFAAVGLSRRRLDAALIEQAASAGCGVERGVTARRIDRDAGCVHLSDGATLSSEAILLATGKHDLRGAARPQSASGSDPAVGMRARLEASPALLARLGGTIELHIFDNGYAGLLLLEDGSANLCLSVAKSLLTRAGSSPGALVDVLAGENPHLADRLGAAQSIGTWSVIANIPYGWRAEPDQPGIFRLGDQGAVIASLVGDGIGIALASGSHAAAVLQAGGAAASHWYQTALRARTRSPLRIAGALKWAAEHPFTHGPVVAAMSAMPSLMRLAARSTRIA